MQETRGGGHTVAKEVGWRRRNNGFGDGDKIFVRSAIGAHRIVRPAIAALTVRSAIGAHRTLVRPVIAALTVRPAIAALTMFINNKNSVKENIP